MRAAPVPPAARRARVAVAVLFSANGATLAGAVTRYPDIKDALELSNTALGTAVAAYWVGALVVGAGAGALVARAGSARIAWTATVVAGLTLLGTGAAPTWSLLAAALFAAGSADAVADVAENAQALRAERMHGRSILNSLHAMWSVGAVTGGALGAAAAGAGVPVLVHLAAVGALVVLLALLASRYLLPGHGEDDATGPALPQQPAVLPEGPPGEDRAGGTGRRAAWGEALRVAVRTAPVVVLLGLLASGAQVMEDTGATWSAVYLRTELGAAAGLAGLGFVALQGAQTVGRLLADRVVTRFGDVACARAGAGLAGTAMAVALVLADPVATVVAFGVVGLGIGTIIPGAMRAADAVPGLRPGTGLTAASTVLRVVGLLAAPLVGLVADATSLRAALLVVPLLALMVVVLAGALRPTETGGPSRSGAPGAVRAGDPAQAPADGPDGPSRALAQVAPPRSPA